MDSAYGPNTRFFDGNALDAARFIFGADCEEVLVHDGWMTIDEEIDVSQVAEEEDFDSEDLESASGGQILEGSRNNTMTLEKGLQENSHIIRRILLQRLLRVHRERKESRYGWMP